MMTDEWRLDILPSDVLLLIFDYCHAFDLVRLSEVCTRFNNIVRDDVLWLERRKQPLATNQASKRFRDRCKKLLCLRTRWHVSENWQSGKYEKKILRSWKVKAMPWIRLTKDVLWWSGGNLLSGYLRRNQNSGPRGAFTKSEKILDRNSIRSDILKFIIRNEFVIGGHTDGSITFFNRNSFDNNCLDLRIDNAHARKINSIDEVPGAIISGSADGTVKLWAQPREATVGVLLTTINVLDRVWSLAGDPTGTTFAVGTSGTVGVPPLKLFDIECSSESISIRHPWRHGAGILDIVWEDPNILLTCGYDTTVRKWDTRIGSCVATWIDPTDATLYCISSDHCFTMVTGSQYNCKAVLWDQRMPNYVQMYFMNNVGWMSSPVYSIAFDSSHLYGVTERNLIELTFSNYGYHQNDFRNIFRSEYSSPIVKNIIR